MPNSRQIARWFLLGTLALGALAGCLSSGDDPTQTPVVIVPTDTATPTEPEPEPTPTDEPTATPTSSPTPEPSPTPSPTPTAPPEQSPQPTRTPIVINTPTPVPPPILTGGVELPDDLLTIMPPAEEGPPGLFIFDEGRESVESIASDAEDSAARTQQLLDWGFQEAVFREYHMADDQVFDPDSQLLVLIALAVLMDSPETARLEMQTHRDEITLPDPELNMAGVAIDPVGDQSAAATGALIDDEGELRLGIVWVTAGPLSLRFIAGSGTQYDPIPDLVRMAWMTLDRLGYSGVPSPGELLLQTDFSNWFTGELESGVILFNDGVYYVRVDLGGGSFVSAYSTDHEPFTDVAVSVDLRMISGDAASQGCVLSRIDQISQVYNYALCVDGTGNVEVLYEQFDAEGGYSFEPLLPEGVISVPPPIEWTTLTIVSRGEEFWFLVDGELVGTARHTGPPGGAAGVIVNNFGEAPTEFLFTNLVVQALQ